MPINRGMDKEDVVHMYNGILLSHKKNQIMPFVVTWIDLELSYWVKSDREWQIYDIAYIRNPKKEYK